MRNRAQQLQFNRCSNTFRYPNVSLRMLEIRLVVPESSRDKDLAYTSPHLGQLAVSSSPSDISIIYGNCLVWPTE